MHSQQNRIIVTLLLGSLAALSCGALLISLIAHIIEPGHYPNVQGLVITAGFCVCIFILWLFTRRGHYQLGIVMTLGLLWLSSIGMAIVWSYELPDAIVLTALTIIVGGILLTDLRSRVFSACVIISLAATGCAELFKIWRPSFDWNDDLLECGDLFGLLIMIVLIALVSWLSNHEMRSALAQARASELELAAERDGLEEKINDRTRQLKQAQRVQMAQLEKFAEFGQLTSGLLHDLANPVTAASLSVQLLQLEHEQSELAEQARASLQSIERYIEAARDQLRLGGRLITFPTKDAILQVVDMLNHRARSGRTRFVLELTAAQLYGDSVKFQQLVANLITNAIDAYENGAYSSRDVIVRTTPLPGGLMLQVIDHGKGIEPDQLVHVFEPFFSTKLTASGTGLGLMLARQTAEHDFHGTLEVFSTPGIETTFTARLLNNSE